MDQAPNAAKRTRRVFNDANDQDGDGDHHPVRAAATGQGQRRSAQNRSAGSASAEADTPLWKNDFKIGPKGMSMEAMTRLQGMCIQHSLGVALTAKVAKSVGVFSTETDNQTVFQTSAKAKTQALHDRLMGVPKQQRKAIGLPPHALVVESTVEEGKKFTAAKGDAELLAPFTEYAQYLDSVETPEERLELILSDFRYARWRTTFHKNRAIFELAVSPIASQQAHRLLKAVTKMLCKYAGGEAKHGIAPKSGLELRLEQALRAMGVWRTPAE
jgi:hypothetical protein